MELPENSYYMYIVPFYYLTEMKAIEEKLNKLIFEINDKDSHSYLNDFVSAFFNKRNEGNRAVMLGLHNKGIIKLLLGTTADVLKEEALYTICINNRREADKGVHILFETISEQNDELRKHLTELFQEYGAGDHYDLVAALKNGYIPNLIIQGDKVREFLDKPHLSFRHLNSENLIKKVTIDWNWTVDEKNLYTSLSELYIITKNNRVIKQQVSESNYEEQLSAIMKGIIPNIETSNFILLNTPDDHIRLYFDSLITTYKKKFNLDETNLSLLSRVFFNLDKETESRLELKNKLNLHSDINELSNKDEDIALYVKLLDILHRNSIEGDTNKTILKYWKEYCDVISCKGKLSNLVTDLEGSIKSLPEQFLKTKTKTEGLVNFLNNPPKKTTKEDCFNLVDEFLLCIADYAIKYNISTNKEIADFKEKIESLKEEYELNKKKWYKNADSSLGKFCSIIAEDVNSLWIQTMSGLSLSDWWIHSIDELEKTHESYLQFVINQTVDSNPSIKMLASLNCQIARYIYALKDLKDNVLKMYDAVKDNDDFIRSEFAESLLVYTSKAQGVLGEECENYSRELSNFISDNAIRVQMQDLLFGELKRIV